MMKKLIRTGFWVSIGAGLGIWFAPSNGREFLREKFALAQVGATKFHKSVSSKWIDDASKKLDSAGKSNLKHLNKREFSAWIKNVQSTYATISEQAIQTQKSVSAVNQYIEGAKSEYKKHHDQIFGM